jgi:hypothetical protein
VRDFAVAWLFAGGRSFDPDDAATGAGDEAATSGAAVLAFPALAVGTVNSVLHLGHLPAEPASSSLMFSLEPQEWHW